MGKIKYLKEIEELFKKSPVVSFSSMERIVRKKRKVKQYAKQIVRNLIKKNKIKRLTKSFYTAYEDPSLAVFCFKPAYLGLQDALSFHNLWEQETIPVIITAKKARTGIRKILGANVLIKRLDKKYLFGFDYHKHGDFYLPYSDIEKTLIDMVYFKELLDKEIIDNIKKRIVMKKLKNYLKAYPLIIRKRVDKIFKFYI
jgi:predicted transcriptional regulator of viral defense system